MTTASALSGEEPAQETPVNVTQLRQPAPKDLPPPDVIKQQAISVTQPSTATDLPILDETSVHLDQIHRPDAPQPVQYKAPTDIQPTTGSILTTASALSGEEPAQETPVNVTQLRQPAPKDLPPSDVTKQQATSITEPSVATDLPILDETSVHLDQIHRPNMPESVQYKAPADIQPSTTTILKSNSALGEEEPAEEASVHVSQLRQAAAKELPGETKQLALSISQPSVAVDLPLLEESAINIDQIQLAQAGQAFEYKTSSNIKEVSATLLSSPSVLASETDQDETMLTSVQNYQQQQGHKTQRPSVVSDRSYAPAEDEFAEVTYEVQVQQQRLLKMPPKLREQPKLIQGRTSIVESDDHTQSTMVGQRRRMVAALQKLEEKKDQTEEEEEKSISPEPSMNVDEVIETIRLEDELVESKQTFIADIPAPTEENLLPPTPAVVDVLPSIQESSQTLSEQISMELNQLEIVLSDQRVEEELPTPTNVEIQSLIKQLDQVSSIKPAPLDLPTTEEVLSSATVEKEPPTPVPEKIEESFEIISSQVIDYIEIPLSKTDSDEQKPEAIIVTDEVKPTESISHVEGTFSC